MKIGKEKIEALKFMVAKNPEVLSELKCKLNDKEITKVVFGAFKKMQEEYENTGDVNSLENNISKLIKECEKVSFYALEQIIKDHPKTLKYVENQSLELCKSIFEYLKGDYGHFMMDIFPMMKHHDYEMAKHMVKMNYKTYLHIKDEFKTEELIKMGVKADGRMLKFVSEEKQTDEIVEIAIRQWAKAIKWAKCPSLEKMQILAIELNLQAMPDNPVSSKVIERFEQLCIENNYYDDVWSPKQNLTQEELYKMLEERVEWAGNYKIYSRLDKDHLKKAIKNGLINHTMKAKVLSEEIYNDIETLYVILESPTRITIEYLYDLNKIDDNTLLDLIEYNPKSLKYIQHNYQTLEMCKKAVELDPTMITYVKVWDEDLTKKLLETL